MRRILFYILLLFAVSFIQAQEYQSDFNREKPKDIEAQKSVYNAGLHASIDLSAFATFGSHVPHRGGFGQNIDLSYLAPLSKDGKLWIDAGGYFNNIFYGSDNYRDAGLHAMIGYRFDEHWEAFLYGQLSLTNNYASYYNRYMGYNSLGYYPGYGSMLSYGSFLNGNALPGANVIGVGAKYNVNKNFSIGINVEGVWYNDNIGSRYSHLYDYPVQKP